MQMPSSIWGDAVIESELTTKYSKMASMTIFTQHELEQTFTEEEIEKLEGLLTEMRTATDDNERNAKLVASIDKVAGVVLKLIKKVVV